MSKDQQIDREDVAKLASRVFGMNINPEDIIDTEEEDVD